MYLDFHTHSQSGEDDVLEIISLHPGVERTYLWYTKGYHPWWTPELLTQQELMQLKETVFSDSSCIALGECGLDRLKGGPLRMQAENLLLQIEIANQLGCPVIIHCVRAFHDLLYLYRNYAKTPWVVHGFRRHSQLARQILDAGLYISVAPDRRIQPSFEETLNFIPLDQIFIESDSDRSLTLGERYVIFSELRQLRVEKIAEQMLENAKIFFSWKNTSFPPGLNVQNS